MRRLTGFLVGVAFMSGLGDLISTAHSHSMDDLKKQFTEIPDPLKRITTAYEATPAGAIRERFHATQHEMIIDHQNTVRKRDCVELLEKIPALERRVQRLEKSGKLDEAEQVQVVIDKAKAFTTVYCPPPLQ